MGSSGAATARRGPPQPWKESVSSLSSFGHDDCEGGRASGSSLKQTHSSVSDVVKDFELTKAISSPDAPKETKPLAAKEGHWSSCVKHTGETSRRRG